MLDIKFIRENPKAVKDGCRKKNVEVGIVDQLLKVDLEKRKISSKIEQLKAEQNKISSQKTNDKKLIKKAKELKQGIKGLESELEGIRKKFKKLIYQVPNIPSEDTLVGSDESGNEPIRKVGVMPKFDFKPEDHLQIGEGLDIIDTKTAAMVSGTRFGYLKGGAVLLEFALVQHAFSILTDEAILKNILVSAKIDLLSKPFVPIVPPVLIKPEVMERMARLEPKEERYHITTDDLYLVGSAEHTLGSMHINQTINESEFPLRYVGFSTAFRREAGSYGKDTKGILRVHQFDKLEMESFTLPEDSLKEQDFIVAIQEYLMQSLKLPYQVVAICTGDMGGPDYRQIDIETWLPGQNKYRETHTSDLMTDYQSRRLNTKVRRKNGRTEFVHMNDATAFAVGRTIIAILENYQQKDGSVLVPEVLRKYMGGMKKIAKTKS